MKTLTQLIFVATLLLSIYAPFSASACTEGEYSSTYNSMCLSDSDFTDTGIISEADIEKFLKKHGSLLYGKNGLIYDVDGTQINPAQLIFENASTSGINPQVVLTQLQKESTAITSPALSEAWQENIMGYNHSIASTIRDQIHYGTAQMGRDYQRLCNGEPTAGNKQVGVSFCSSDEDKYKNPIPLSVTPASKPVTCLYSYNPIVGTDWGGDYIHGGNALFCELWDQWNFGLRDLIIDDWENDGLLWSASDPLINISLSSQSLQGKKSMEMDVSAGSEPEETIYDHPAVSWTGDVAAWWYTRCYGTWADECGQKLVNGPGKRITKIKLYLCNFISTCDYMVTLEPRIYKNVGNLPGQLFATGEDYVLSGSQLPFPASIAGHEATYTPITLQFENGGVDIPTDGEYNISIKAVKFTLTSVYLGDYDTVSPAIPMIPDVWSYSFYNWSGELLTYYLDPSYGLAAQIYAKSPSYVSRVTSCDCSRYSKFKITAKSYLAGNVLDLVYGTDKDHTVDAPMTINNVNDWEAIEIPISSSIDTSRLSYFAFKLGKDSFDGSTGDAIANTIYIDQLEAE